MNTFFPKGLSLQPRFLWVIVVLLTSSLACQTILGAAPGESTPILGENFSDETSTEVNSAESIFDEGEEAVSTTMPLETRPPSPSQQTNMPGDNVIETDITSFVDQNSLVDLYEQVSPGVVAIRVLSQEGDGQGSGFLIDQEGHIVTNFHVVADITDLEVAFPSGYKVRGEVVGTDLDSDLAVIKVDAPDSELHPIPLGDSDQINVGQFVVAIGNPFGLSGTMTIGIVSAKGRVLESLNEAPGGNFFSAGDLIQTDAAINPGNSGGPLLNLNGEVIGVNRAIRTDNINPIGTPSNSGIGFAISINILKQVVPSLIEQGFYHYPYIGISSLPEVTLLVQEELNLPQSTGAYVTQVVPGGPADDAGLEDGDLIIAVDSREVLVFGDLLSYIINQKHPGDEIVLTVLRQEEEVEIPVTLERRP